MFGDGPLTFQEFITRERLPLARVHDAVLDFLRGREDCVLCGAHAVNAYVNTPRMSQDVDILSNRAAELARELRIFLKHNFEISPAIDVREAGFRFCLYQVRRPSNRHLVDIRLVSELPDCQEVEEVLVLTPPELIASKVLSMVRRRGPKRGLDMADLYRVLLAFPELKADEGAVTKCLRSADASREVMAAWKELVAREILAEEEDDKFRW
jgi:hypothetical protein